MKKHLFPLILAAMAAPALAAQTDMPADSVEGFVFTTVKANPITSVKNQHRSSTCWSFSSMAFFESELLRMGKGEYDLSEMFVVHHTMVDRAERAVRLHGDVSFAPGGSFNDAVYCLAHYGMVPQTAMPGIMYGDTLPVHTELDAVAGAYVKALTRGTLKQLTPVWRQGLSAIYDTYLGVCPETFDYDGRQYTPRSFADMLGLSADDYVSVTSYTHHPFYEKFVLEIPDNWRLGESYNVPLDELIAIIDHAIEQGYTVAWGADVSEIGFTRNGIGVLPDADRGAELTGSDMARWTGLSKDDKKKELTQKPLPEMEVTQAMRQTAYDNWTTTDDHGMLIYGIATDQNGKEYYMVKNSWGTNNKYQGTWYISKAFAAYKTMNILVHKDAVPKAIAKKWR
ncbi:MAG: C1 family peptidase [Bacteroidales bacterium]|nr:C1 family peptidase [Bacteroidales bacterium]MDY6036610.1 C1 family peptidase [Paludibacteraceae bacterium]